MNFHKLKIFCSVVETGSITETSRKLMISPPAVFMHIRDIEKHFNTILTLRQGRNIKITESGTAVYHFAKQVLALEESFRANLQATAPKINIGVCLFIVGLMRNLFVNHNISAANLSIKPELSINIYQQVLNGDLDIGIILRSGTPQSSVKLIQENIMRIPLVVISSANHPLNHQRIEKRQVENEPFITTAHQDHDAYCLTGQSGLNVKNAILQVNDMETVKLFVMKGRGLGIASLPDVEQDIKEGRLGMIEFSDFEFDTLFSLIYLPHNKSGLEKFKHDLQAILPSRFAI